MAGTDAVVIALPAELDMSNAAGVSGQIAAVLAPGPRVVVADMTRTTFCDSTGVRVLVLAHQHAAANGTELRVLLPSPHILRIMEVLGVDAVLPIYPSMAAAVAGGAAADAES